MSASLQDTPSNPIAVPQPKQKPLRYYLRPIALLAILLVAAIFRLHDLNWDQNRHLHPDERYMSVLASLLKPPDDLRQYFDSGASPLNPFNTDWGKSYVYGTLPLFAGRYFAQFFDSGCGEQGSLIPKLLGQAIFRSEAANCQLGAFTAYDLLTLVGRFMSAMVDVITVFVVYLLGRKLFGWRVGLLAAAFGAFTVLQIQQSHYFTVDGTANLFVTLSLYFSACVAMLQITAQPSASQQDVYRLWGYASLAGLMAGCAVASKISTWPTVAIIVVSIIVALLRDRRRDLRLVLDSWLAVVLAGIFAFIGFRVAQPYAFVGNSASEFELTIQQCQTLPPGALTTVCRVGAALPSPLREVFAPSARWIDQLNLAQGFVNGTIDAPFGIQWADRTPIVFPLINLLFWGLGLPLGITALIGFFYALSRLLHGRRWWAYLPFVLWTGAYFLYQSTQWTKSIRYLLPIYPTLCICAALVLVALWRNMGRQTIDERRPETSVRLSASIRRLIPIGAISLVIIGSLIWSLAFLQIYADDITRVTASRWIFENVPTAVTLSWDEADRGSRRLQLPVREIDLRANQDAPAFSIRLNSRFDHIAAPLRAPRLTLNYLQGEGEVEARLIEAQGTNTVLQAVRQSINSANPTLVFDQATLEPDREYFVELALKNGQRITARTTVVANEHWDDGLPQPIDGKDPFGAYYRGLSSSSDGQIQNYAEEDPNKYPQMLSWLDEADYLFLSSNRLYGSIPRMPWRYPLATEYYRALFNGELGFDLVADYSSFPRIGELVFNDQEIPQFLQRSPNTQGTPPEIEAPYPTAEEAFSVYDHPRVLVFKKTDRYSRELAERILGQVDLSRTIKQTPLKAANTPRGMLFDEKTWVSQQAGGTWSELFPRSSPLNQSQPLAVLAWLVLIELLGLATFPIIAAVTTKVTRLEPRVTSHEPRTTRDSSLMARDPSLIDAGYSFAKVLGLFLVAFIVWWLASVKITPFAAPALWGLVALLVIVGVLVTYRNREELTQLVQTRWPILLISELLFLGAFVFFLIVRIGNPDLWHPYMGGEKPMDFAYLNGVLKSTYFPPIDPWFSGGYINYYYFGFVVVGWPIKALGIDPAVAYNIVIPTLFALTACGAFGLGTTLYASRSRGAAEQGREGAEAKADLLCSSIPLPPIPRSLARPIIVGLLAALFIVGVGNGGQIDVISPAWQKLGGVDQGMVAPIAFVNGFIKWLGGTPLPIYPNWPYWNATRLTAGQPVDAVPIAEFPQFTFLYADLHAHMIAMPIAYLSLAFALAFAAGVRRWPALILGAMTVGSLWAINTWDYPPYLLLMLAGLVMGALTNNQHSIASSQSSTNVLRRLFGVAPVLIAFFALSRLFFVPYLDNYGAAYNSIDPWNNEHTPLNTYIIIYGLFLIPLAVYLLWNVFSEAPLNKRLSQIALVIGMILGVLFVLREVPIALIAGPMTLLALAAALFLDARPQTRMAWLMTAGGFAITLFVELFVLRGDIGRMNTVFKFYIQAWLLLGVTAAVALMWVIDRFAEAHEPAVIEPALGETNAWSSVVGRPSSVFKFAFAVAVGIALFLAVLYPVFAIPAKMNDRYVATAPRGLDGMAYMQSATRAEGPEGRVSEFELRHDYDAIKWLQDNVKGSPTIFEGTTGGNLYRWGNRYSIYTGLPSVIGWQWHQRQQRAALDDRVVYDRDNDIAEFYTTPDIDHAEMLIRRYNPEYIIVGPLERIYYSPIGFEKFSAMVKSGDLSVSYQNPEVTIYKVTPATHGK